MASPGASAPKPTRTRAQSRNKFGRSGTTRRYLVGCETERGATKKPLFRFQRRMACKDCHLISPGRTGGELAPASRFRDRLLWLQRAQPSATLDKIPHQVVEGHLRGERSRDQRKIAREPEKNAAASETMPSRRASLPDPSDRPGRAGSVSSDRRQTVGMAYSRGRPAGRVSRLPPVANAPGSPCSHAITTRTRSPAVNGGPQRCAKAP